MYSGHQEPEVGVYAAAVAAKHGLLDTEVATSVDTCTTEWPTKVDVISVSGGDG